MRRWLTGVGMVGILLTLVAPVKAHSVPHSSGRPNGNQWHPNPRLLTAICQQESAGETHKPGGRAKAEGDSGASIGVCQVKITTAAFLLQIPAPRPHSHNWWLVRSWLQDPGLNLAMANMMLLACAAHGYRTDEAQAFCYCNGWNAGQPKRTRYVHEVLRRMR
ncbi:MAG: hypothetical protein KGL39_06905 [Patescibacteria group bacterium]|nr:hypothetical protein [Patescibacteria group bacterium]